MKKTIIRKPQNNNLRNGGCDYCGNPAEVKTRSGKGQFAKIFLCLACRQNKSL